jgi:hypothetical protein
LDITKRGASRIAGRRASGIAGRGASWGNVGDEIGDMQFASAIGNGLLRGLLQEVEYEMDQVGREIGLYLGPGGGGKCTTSRPVRGGGECNIGKPTSWRQCNASKDCIMLEYSKVVITMIIMPMTPILVVIVVWVVVRYGLLDWRTFWMSMLCTKCTCSMDVLILNVIYN